MVEDINKMLEEKDVMVRCHTEWYRLESIHIGNGKMPIVVSDEDGGEHEFDMGDIEDIESDDLDFDFNFDTTQIGVA